ncbi:MAG TPA: NAD-dependent epimerase/dehydratase family protein [Acidimicrobiales bacterium]|nr:NAD-dependent epimerase/dehydratase family protein [Acidimicrobiales bacterium]
MVTGGAGFIGSTLVDRLLAEGHAVDVVDDLSSGTLANLAEARAGGGQQLSFNRLDVRSPDLVDLMARRHPEVVFHLAAQVDVRSSVLDPVHDAHVNVVGSLNVLEGARAGGATKVVFASSGAADQPVSPYGVAKRTVTEYLRVYRELHELEFTSLALTNVFGPRQDPEGEGGVVAIFAGRLLSGQPCTIYGDGSQIRDFVYVDDVVDAFARAATRGGGLLLNIGTGMETSIRDLHRMMAGAMGADEPPEFAPARGGELDRMVADPARAGIHLGWKPWTTLEDGVASVLRWCHDQSAAD